MNIQKMMKQVQDAQSRMAAVQEDLAARTVEASAGGGAVKVVMGGDGTLRGITLSPEAVNADDIEMLQDLILAAVNEGKRKSSELAAQEMRKAAGGLGLPPGLF